MLSLSDSISSITIYKHLCSFKRTYVNKQNTYLTIQRKLAKPKWSMYKISTITRFLKICPNLFLSNGLTARMCPSYLCLVSVPCLFRYCVGLTAALPEQENVNIFNISDSLVCLNYSFYFYLLYVITSQVVFIGTYIY